MSATASIQIIGAPIACKEGLKDAWRDVAEWAARELEARFGKCVSVQYFDLFDPDCPPLPPQVHLPVVLINNENLPSGGKISIPIIRKRLEELGLEAISQSSA
jgi:hypothetical protein